MTKTTFLRALSVTLLLATLSGCGFIDYAFLPPPKDTAQELWEAGRDAMREKRYTAAQEDFLSLKDRYPFSPYAADGVIGLGDAYFMDGKFQEAADAYKEFESLHPRHEMIPYVLYQIGVSTYRKLDSIDLPQDGLGEAIQYFTLLKDRYPNTQWGQDAPNWIAKSRTRMADHEILVADFYWNTGRYGAAWRRYTYVAEHFRDLPDVFKYARDKAQIAYLEYQKTLSEDERRSVEGSWHNFVKKWL